MTSIQFRATVTDEELDVGVGMLRRTFKRAEQPFAMSAAEAEQYLTTGYFEVAAEPPAKKPNKGDKN